MKDIVIEQTDKNTPDSIIYDLLEIENEVYEEKYCGDFESIKKRFRKFPQQCFLAKYNEEIVGYFCFLPISNKLYDEIINGNSFHDNDIKPEEMVSIDQCEHLYLLSVAIKSDFQNKGFADGMMRKFESYVQDCRKKYSRVKDIVTSAVTSGGERFLERYDYRFVKEGTDFKIFKKNLQETKKDIFIFIPVKGKFEKKYEIDENMVSENSVLYKEELDKLAETSTTIKLNIERYALEDIDLVYYPYEEYSENPKEYETIKTGAVISYLEKIQLGLILLIIPQCKIDLTYFGEAILPERLRVKYKEEYVPFEEFSQKEYNIKLCGMPKTVYCAKRGDIGVFEKQYLLAGEKIRSKHTDYNIENAEIRRIATTNLASYDFYELYASERATILCTNNFGNFSENLEKEKLLTFICEIAMLQKAAIYRINDEIVNALKEDSDVSTRKIRDLQVEFGKSVLLWDNNIYNYSMAQRLSDKIVEAMGTKRLYDEYIKNKTHIEHIAKIKNNVYSNLTNLIISFLGFIIAIKQLLISIIDPKNEKDLFWGFIEILIFVTMLGFIFFKNKSDIYMLIKKRVMKK